MLAPAAITIECSADDLSLLQEVACLNGLTVEDVATSHFRQWLNEIRVTKAAERKKPDPGQVVRGTLVSDPPLTIAQIEALRRS